MKVSIITINLNNKEGLEKTIKSVICQTFFSEVEYIIIDGGSTDGSVELIESYDKYLAHWISEKDNGIYNAMNKGVTFASGEYCLFLNSGDFLHSNDVIEKIIPDLSKDIVYGDLNVWDGETSFIKRYTRFLPKRYFRYDTLPHPSTFIKTSIIKMNPYNTTYKIISDWIFFFENIIYFGKTYKHIELVVSDFKLGGISSNKQLIQKEKENYNKKFKISIIIPCYNQSKYVQETINSLLNSTYKEWECVIINDGSTDNSEEKIFEIIKSDKRFRYYKQTNKGLSISRNIGIKLCNGEYVLCLDSDDKISPTYIENGIKFLDENLDYSAYYGKAKMFYDDGTEKDWNLQTYSYEKLLSFNMIYCSLIYRKNLFEKCGGYDETMNGYEDWEFLIRMLYNRPKVFMTEDVVFYYRRHSDSMDAKQRSYANDYRSYIIEKNIYIYIKYAKLKKINKD